jgi:propionyl-CoA synthetase
MAGYDVDSSTLERELVAAIREDIGPVAAFKDVSVVPALPKTRSGKILRKTMRQIADGQDPAVPSTIEDPGVLEAIAPTLRAPRAPHGG